MKLPRGVDARYRRFLPFSLAVAAFILFMGLWGVERYIVPMFPPLAVLLTADSKLAPRPRAGSELNLDDWFGATRGWVGGALVALLFVPTFSLAWLVHTQPAQTVQLVYYVKQNYQPHQVVVVGMDEYRKFQFYAPEYQIYGHVPLEPIPKPDSMLNEMGRMGWKTYNGRVVLITGSAWRYLAPSFPWARPVLLASFARDPFAGS
jgi:hypothetical protein